MKFRTLPNNLFKTYKDKGMWNTFSEIVTVADRYLYNYIRNKESKKCPFRIADGKISMKMEKNSSYLIYNIVTLSKMAGKIKSFVEKIS